MVIRRVEQTAPSPADDLSEAAPSVFTRRNPRGAQRSSGRRQSRAQQSLVEKPRLLNTTSSAVLRLPFPPRNKSRMERGPTASSVNTFGCFSLRSTLTVIGSGTFKHKKHEAFTGPAAKGSVPFTGKALERTRPEPCEWVLEPPPPAADGPQRTRAGGERASWHSAGLGRRQARRGWAGIPNCTYAPYTC